MKHTFFKQLRRPSNIHTVTNFPTWATTSQQTPNYPSFKCNFYALAVKHFY